MPVFGSQFFGLKNRAQVKRQGVGHLVDQLQRHVFFVFVKEVGITSNHSEPAGTGDNLPNAGHVKGGLFDNTTQLFELLRGCSGQLLDFPVKREEAVQIAHIRDSLAFKGPLS